MGQMYLLLGLTYSFARCTFIGSLGIEWVSSWLLRTRVTDVNSILLLLNTLVVKILLVLRLWAIWNKDLIGEKSVPMDLLYWRFWILVTLIVYFMTAGMLSRIRFLIDRDVWWLTLVEVLVCFKDSMVINPQTDCIFQSAMSVVVVDAFLNSVSGALLPLHGCWLNPSHLSNISNGVSTAFEYVYNHVSLCWLAYLFSNKKELSGQQWPQSKSSWHLLGLPWHTRHKWFLVMEYLAVFLTWKLQLVYYMYFTTMEPCYSYCESKNWIFSI